MAKLTPLEDDPAPPPAATAAPGRVTQSLSLTRPVESLHLLLTSPKHFSTLAAILLVNEALLCLVIIHYIPYTEIDWSSYMQQVKLFLHGERDYSLLKGSTGPLVYPAGFVYFYSALYYLTDKGKDIRMAQYIFAEIYVVTLGMVFVIYKRCGSLPPYVLIAITLSKRLHSIYVLRLFNDGVAMLFFYAAVLAWTNKRNFWTAGSVLFSLALSIKMNLLLYLPALLYLFFTTLGALPTLLHLSLIALIQAVLATPFVTSPQAALIYLSTAFNFSREFLWEWTVNWRWLGEEAFESSELSRGLLVGNVLALVLFGATWAETEGGVWKLLGRGLRKPMEGAVLGRPSADFIVTVLFTSNLTGILFARSLHYQFYAWYAHQIIFLAWHTPFDLIQRFAMVAVIEYAWNVFPSTVNSSMALTATNLFILAGVYYGAPTGVGRERVPWEKEGARKVRSKEE